MYVSDVVEKGAVTLKKEDDTYVIEYTNYNPTGEVSKQIFKDRDLRLAYMKLEEYLSL